MHELQLTDWHRILFGAASWPFLAEVLLRTIFTFLLLVGTVRLLGRRVAAQFTLLEMAVLVTLAGAIGVPLQTPDRGLMGPLVIAAVVVVLQRTVMYYAARHRRMEAALTTGVSTLVRDGRLVLDALRPAALSADQVFALLRVAGFQHLGQVGRAYMEPSGKLTVVPATQRRPGLSVLPRFERALRDEAACAQWRACQRCGHTVAASPVPAASGVAPCGNCGGRAWSPAMGELSR